MIRARAAFGVLAATSLVLSAACHDATTPSSPAARPDARAQAPDLAGLARSVPGFGGLYLDAGVPTVYLTDPRQRGLVERALGGYARGLGLAPAAIRVRQGRYDYQTLDRWFRRVSGEAFTVAGVVFVDLDEAANRVLIGVEHAAAGSSARGVAARLGVPAEAVTVREVAPIHFAATLRDHVRPVVAGLQINFGFFVCTLGFNATSGTQSSFVTASHCTDRQGGTEGTAYFQPLASTAGSFIGTEVDDPVYFRDGVCPRGRKCRFSDASRAAYAPGVDFALGGIARTSGPNNGSLEITGTFRIVNEGASVVGDVVNKIGRTTGWTQGAVTNTCVDTGVFGSNIVQLCQTFVSAGVGGGDSGSDVFALKGGGSRVTLLGVLWGGSGDGTLFVYSPIANVEQELGPLTTH